jgi:glycolate oxidase iron-sulfur subunit
MEGARDEIAHRERPRGARSSLRAWLVDIVTKPRLLDLLTSLASLYERSRIGPLARRFLPARLAGIASLAPSPEGRSFAGASRPDADMQILAGCVMRSTFGDTQRATVRLLEKGGHQVSSPAAQTCCGALHAHAGLGDRARELARQNVAAFSGGSPIVVTAAGCGSHMRAYGELLASDGMAADARAVAARVRDASEVVSPADARRTLSRPIRVVYQDACHLAHGQGIRKQPRDLLRAIEGVEIVPIVDPERCCGSAGIYNLTHPEVASELQRQKVEAIGAVRPDVVVSANPGCILQVRAGLREAGSDVPVVHLMRFLDDPEGCLA